jgi:hypothetical protein
MRAGLPSRTHVRKNAKTKHGFINGGYWPNRKVYEGYIKREPAGRIRNEIRVNKIRYIEYMQKKEGNKCPEERYIHTHTQVRNRDLAARDRRTDRRIKRRPSLRVRMLVLGRVLVFPTGTLRRAVSWLSLGSSRLGCVLFGPSATVARISPASNPAI